MAAVFFVLACLVACLELGLTLIGHERRSNSIPHQAALGEVKQLLI